MYDRISKSSQIEMRESQAICDSIVFELFNWCVLVGDFYESVRVTNPPFRNI
jgi:hypothetical protein